MRICFFDLETRKKPEALASGNEGWSLLKQGKGGISALAIYDSQEQWCYLYDDNSMQTIAEHLESADSVVGWNSIDFDAPCVEGLLGRKLVLREHIDICKIVKDALSLAGHPMRKGENTLGAVCNRTLGMKKLEDGALAPELADKGEWGRLFNYCAHDVKMTRDLYTHMVLEGGFISSANTFVPICLPHRVP